VFSADGRAMAAISISGPALRLRPERMDEMGALLVKETTMLSERLGYRRPKEGAA
jgi:DNA-binding IclR family transcriptional regulator